MISFAVNAKLICVFVFAYAKSRFSNDAVHFSPYYSSSSFCYEDRTKTTKLLRKSCPRSHLSRVCIQYSLICENKGGDQLGDNRAADQCLCFRYSIILQNFKPLAICGYTAWFSLDLVGNQEGRFSRNAAYSTKCTQWIVRLKGRPSGCYNQMKQPIQARDAT